MLISFLNWTSKALVSLKWPEQSMLATQLDLKLRTWTELDFGNSLDLVLLTLFARQSKTISLRLGSNLTWNVNESIMRQGFPTPCYVKIKTMPSCFQSFYVTLWSFCICLQSFCSFLYLSFSVFFITSFFWVSLMLHCVCFSHFATLCSCFTSRVHLFVVFSVSFCGPLCSCLVILHLFVGIPFICTSRACVW